MNASACRESRFFVRENMTRGEVIDFASGVVGVFSARSPEKQSDNEDAAIIIPCEPGKGVIAIADGVGGQPAGALAASLAMQAMNDAVQHAAASGSSLRDAIVNGFEEANQAISAIGVGAATTLTVVEIDDDRIRPYHAGDSLILLVGQRGRIRLQTLSHSPVGYAVESGLLAEREAMHHEDRHLVSNMVGSPELRIEIGPALTMKPRDTLLVASDGLFDNLHTEEIIDLVRAGPLKQVIRRLADRCQSRMAQVRDGEPSKPDDLTFIAFRQQVRKRAVAPRSSDNGAV